MEGSLLLYGRNIDFLAILDVAVLSRSLVARMRVSAASTADGRDVRV